MAVVAAAEY